jgi:hypothetical protein
MIARMSADAAEVFEEEASIAINPDLVVVIFAASDWP